EMRVSIVAPVDPLVERPGGTRTYIMSLVRSLRKADIEFSLVGVDFDPSDGSPAYDFIPVVEAPKVSSVKYLRGLMNVAKKTRFTDDTIIHAQRPDHLFPFMFRNHPNKMLCTLHGQVLRSVGHRKGSFFGRAYSLLESYSMKRIDYAIAVDKSTLDLYAGRYHFLSERSSVIPIGIDIEEWGTRNRTSSREALGFDHGRRIGLYVGRLEKEKRVDLIIESIPSVLEAVEEFSLFVIGDGTLRRELEEKANSVAPGSVTFMGPQPTRSVRDMMAAADVFCLASDFESGPLVVLESLASGTPVVATDVGRVREFLPDSSTGRVIAQDPRAMASAVVDILGADRDEMARKCVEKAKEFNFKTTFEKTLGVYEDLS
ncbi:MAG: glycosyltransferase family 4 protein, partial [Thermoplasmata archaeon]|nr:glycosyltransferase family 4 protein [Thermoplasmata archaeon]